MRREGSVWCVLYSSGAINALFSALAFSGVIIAIILQKKELELQRDELKATNKQLEAQKNEFQAQNDTLRRQRFENTFFQMMSLQQEIVNGLSIQYNEKQRTTEAGQPGFAFTEVKSTLTGRIVFYKIFENSTTLFYGPDGAEHKFRSIRDAIEAHGIDIYCSLINIDIFDHYFRHLYRILKFVDTTDLIDDCDKYEYTAMVRATLSKHELVWLFYNCLSLAGKDKFKPLIERYALLKNLRKELLIDKKHLSQYDSSAYNHLA